MPTIAQVDAAIRSRLGATVDGKEIRYPNEERTVPETPAIWAFVELHADDHDFIAIGAGRGANLQRTAGQIQAHILVPTGEGVAEGLALGEAICVLFRGVAADSINYGAAEVYPTSGRADQSLSEDGKYHNCCTAIINLHFDKLG